MVRNFLLTAIVGGAFLAGMVGCQSQGDTGIGAESGRLIGQSVTDDAPYLGGQIGGLLGRNAEKGIAESTTQPASNSK